ncbi:probable mitochondrial-processing peptidase subunit alpha-2, chloroplastic/mitochondrial isoform X1 [Telopea speciosissima]|uniref:probable mitochondrial-processing peptidase subunit alpha-2, chloroplastic/mitochondrial isoform X1 n=1 Tax=Telopea speciosissima TaxID=54955 RepID=UPI001CC597A1|nr:probable mitochondrial-processing peptidase subunit alpha-2, chloroplastic/mitochondrial isoform X1 [Telopea speciosissima]
MFRASNQVLLRKVAKGKAEIEAMLNNPQQFLLESLHLTGYSGALANPLMSPELVFEETNRSAIQMFYYDNYTAERMVLAAYGMDHEQLLAIAEHLLNDIKSGHPKVVPKTDYVGGDFRHRVNSEKTHVSLAFEVPGVWIQDKDAIALTVLQSLMGGGGSFSIGGLGKGMQSQLCE